MATKPLSDERAKWTVRAKIEKYHTIKAFKEKKIDEILELPGNSLTNEGVNHLWKLIANINESGTAYSNSQSGVDAPFGTNAYIGVGNNNDVQGGTPEATDTGLNAALATSQNGSYMYMKMDADGEVYPKAGTDQKIVFKSTFYPGVACFNWYEWTIANGNGNGPSPGNHAQIGFNDDEVRLTAKGDDQAPSPRPEAGQEYQYGVGEENVINLNHKIESMGKKYAQATWIVTVEISLS